MIARGPGRFGRGRGWVSTGPLLWGAGRTLATAANEVRDFLSARYEPQAMLGLAAAWAALFAWLARRLAWRAALALLTLPIDRDDWPMGRHRSL